MPMIPYGMVIKTLISYEGCCIEDCLDAFDVFTALVEGWLTIRSRNWFSEAVDSFSSISSTVNIFWRDM